MSRFELAANAATTVALESTGAGLCALALEPAGVVAHAFDGQAWTTRLVHEGARSGLRAATGPDGALWLAWDVGGRLNQGIACAEGGLGLQVARVTAQAVEVEPVATALWAYGYGSKHWALAVGPDGAPVLAWNHQGKVTLARRAAGGQWTQEKGPAAARDWVELAVDAEGRAHLLFEQNEVLHHAVQAGAGWVATPVGARYETAYCALAVGAAGLAHVAWLGRAKTKDHLCYARVGGGAPVTPEVVDKKGNAGMGVRLRLDAEGRPVLGYRVEASREGAGMRKVVPAEHRVARSVDGAWQTQSLGEGGWANAVALHAGQPWLAFPTSLRSGLTVLSSPP